MEAHYLIDAHYPTGGYLPSQSSMSQDENKIKNEEHMYNLLTFTRWQLLLNKL